MGPLEAFERSCHKSGRHIRPNAEVLYAYALVAVKDERLHPLNWSYDRIAAMDDVLHHFPALTLEDEDEIRQAVRKAEDQLYPEGD